MKPSPSVMGDFNSRRCSASRAARWPVDARGFTLIELMVSLAVLLILSTVTGWSMNAMVSNNRIYATQNEFVAAVALARSEAARRGLPVMVSATAAATGNAFGNGWTVWVDTDGTGSFDSASDPLLRSHEAVPSSIVIGDGATTMFGFSSMGFLTQARPVDIKVCASDGSVPGFDVTIQPNGIVDVADVAAHSRPCS